MYVKSLVENFSSSTCNNGKYHLFKCRKDTKRCYVDHVACIVTRKLFSPSIGSSISGGFGFAAEESMGGNQRLLMIEMQS